MTKPLPESGNVQIFKKQGADFPQEKRQRNEREMRKREAEKE